MTIYEKTARTILDRLKPLGMLVNDEGACIQAVIDVLIEMQPGRNDALLEAHLVANYHKQLYPEHVFPANGLTPHDWAARGCRLVADSIGIRILELRRRDS